MSLIEFFTNVACWGIGDDMSGNTPLGRRWKGRKQRNTKGRYLGRLYTYILKLAFKVGSYKIIKKHSITPMFSKRFSLQYVGKLEMFSTKFSSYLWIISYKRDVWTNVLRKVHGRHTIITPFENCAWVKHPYFLVDVFYKFTLTWTENYTNNNLPSKETRSAKLWLMIDCMTEHL